MTGMCCEKKKCDNYRGNIMLPILYENTRNVKHYHLTPIRMATIKKKKRKKKKKGKEKKGNQKISSGKNVEKLKPLCTVNRNVK